MSAKASAIVLLFLCVMVLLEQSSARSVREKRKVGAYNAIRFGKRAYTVPDQVYYYKSYIPTLNRVGEQYDDGYYE